MAISQENIYAEIYYLGAIFSIDEVPVNFKVVFQKGEDGQSLQNCCSSLR